MANAQRGELSREKTRSHNAMVEEIVPSSAWTEDSEGHYLLVDLPGFKKQEVKLQIDDLGNITVSGERLVRDNKFIIFEKTFKMPENANADEISGKFDGEILYVTVPKQPIKKPEEKPQNTNNDTTERESVEDKNAHKHKSGGQEDHYQQDQVKEKEAKKIDHSSKDGFPRELVEKWGLQEGSSVLACAMEMLKKHKGIVITAAFAFSLGFLVGRKF